MIGDGIGRQEPKHARGRFAALFGLLLFLFLPLRLLPLLLLLLLPLRRVAAGSSCRGCADAVAGSASASATINN